MEEKVETEADQKKERLLKIARKKSSLNNLSEKAESKSQLSTNISTIPGLELKNELLDTTTANLSPKYTPGPDRILQYEKFSALSSGSPLSSPINSCPPEPRSITSYPQQPFISDFFSDPFPSNTEDMIDNSQSFNVNNETSQFLWDYVTRGRSLTRKVSINGTSRSRVNDRVSESFSPTSLIKGDLINENFPVNNESHYYDSVKRNDVSNFKSTSCELNFDANTNSSDKLKPFYLMESNALDETLDPKSSLITALQSRIEVLEGMLEHMQIDFSCLKNERDEIKYRLETEFEEKIKNFEKREAELEGKELNLKAQVFELEKEMDSSAKIAEKNLELKKSELEKSFKNKFEQLEKKEDMFNEKFTKFETEFKKFEIEKSNFQNLKLNFQKEHEQFFIEKENFFKLKDGNESESFKKLKFFENEEKRLKLFESKIYNFSEEVNLKDQNLKEAFDETEKKSKSLEEERNEIEKSQIALNDMKIKVENDCKEVNERFKLLEKEESLFFQNKSKWENEFKLNEESYQHKHCQLMEEISLQEEARKKFLDDKNLMENQIVQLCSREVALKKIYEELLKNTLQFEDDVKDFNFKCNSFYNDKEIFEIEKQKILDTERKLLDEAKIFKDLKIAFEKEKTAFSEKKASSRLISQHLLNEQSSEAEKLVSLKKKLDQEKRLLEFERNLLNEREEKNSKNLKNIEAKELEVKEEQHKLVKVHETFQVNLENLNKRESHLKTLMQEVEFKNTNLNNLINENNQLKADLENEKLSLNTREDHLKDEKLKIENEKDSILKNLKQTQSLVGEKFEILEEEKKKMDLTKENLEQEKKKLKFEQEELQLSKSELENQSCKLNEQLTWIEKEKGAINELRMKLDQDRIDFERNKLESGGKIAKKKAEKVTGEADSVSSILEEINAESIFKSSANTKPASSPSSSINKGDALVNRNYETELNYFKERIMNLENSNTIFQENIVNLNEKLDTKKRFEENDTKNIPSLEKEKIKNLLE
ncbi:hypothetical protein HK099_000695, partial [Clydaea vesicula]